MSQYVIIDGQLYHHGIKGQKWGVRRYQNTDGSLTPAGIKRYAQRGYAKDSYNRNKTVIGKVYDKLTDAHKYDAKARYRSSTQEQNKKRAEKQFEDEQKAKENKRIDKAAKKGFIEDSYNSNKTVLGKAYDKITGAHKIGGELLYNLSSKQERTERGKRYLEEIMKKDDSKNKRKTVEYTVTDKSGATYKTKGDYDSYLKAKEKASKIGANVSEPIERRKRS